MKKQFLFFLLAMVISTGYAITNEPTSNGTKLIVVVRGSSQHNHLYQPVGSPEVIFYLSSSTLAIDFGNQPIEDYTVTISSPFTDVDYYVTSSYTTIPLIVDGFSDYTIIIETCDGDVFEGTLAASDYTTTATF